MREDDSEDRKGQSAWVRRAPCMVADFDVVRMGQLMVRQESGVRSRRREGTEGAPLAGRFVDHQEGELYNKAFALRMGVSQKSNSQTALRSCSEASFVEYKEKGASVSFERSKRY